MIFGNFIKCLFHSQKKKSFLLCRALFFQPNIEKVVLCTWKKTMRNRKHTRKKISLLNRSIFLVYGFIKNIRRERAKYFRLHALCYALFKFIGVKIIFHVFRACSAKVGLNTTSTYTKALIFTVVKLDWHFFYMRVLGN